MFGLMSKRKHEYEVARLEERIERLRVCNGYYASEIDSMRQEIRDDLGTLFPYLPKCQVQSYYDPSPEGVDLDAIHRAAEHLRSTAASAEMDALVAQIRGEVSDKEDGND